MRYALLAALLLSISCVDPVCACSPPRIGMVLRGTLVSSTDVPQPGKRVRADLAVATCTTYYPGYASGVSAADGKLVLELDTFGVDSVCVRLFARDTVAGAVEQPLVGPLRLPRGTTRFDTVTVPLVIAP
jgi:hypothetical protein